MSAVETTYASVETPNEAQSLPSGAPPDAGQRTHWLTNVGAGSPVQVPCVAVRVWPTAGVPVMVGGAVFTGGAWSCAPPVGAQTTARATRERAARTKYGRPFERRIGAMGSLLRFDDPRSMNVRRDGQASGTQTIAAGTTVHRHGDVDRRDGIRLDGVVARPDRARRRGRLDRALRPGMETAPPTSPRPRAVDRHPAVPRRSRDRAGRPPLPARRDRGGVPPGRAHAAARPRRRPWDRARARRRARAAVDVLPAARPPG